VAYFKPFFCSERGKLRRILEFPVPAQVSERVLHGFGCICYQPATSLRNYAQISHRPCFDSELIIIYMTLIINTQKRHQKKHPHLKLLEGRRGYLKVPSSKHLFRPLVTKRRSLRDAPINTSKVIYCTTVIQYIGLFNPLSSKNKCKQPTNSMEHSPS
jgi:hypothetical protein